MKILRDILATLVGFSAGATITVLLTIIVLEMLHTKDGFINLFVAIVALVVGAGAAVRLRRVLMGTSTSAEQSHVDQP